MGSTITAREAVEIEQANASGRRTVVFVHGLWLLAGSWDPWRAKFEDAGYATVAIDWPGDATSVDAARTDSQALAGLSVATIADHVTEVTQVLAHPPVIVGHSFGGLLVQIVAGRGLANGTVSIDPGPSKGVLPLPFSALKSSFPVLRRPANRTRVLSLTLEEFRYGFANAVSPDESRDLYERLHVPGPGRPLFQAASANVVPWSTATKADKKNPDRGPMLIITGDNDHIAPAVMARAAFRKQRKNPAVTEFAVIGDAGHSLVIDHRWTSVADASLAFLAENGLTPQL